MEYFCLANSDEIGASCHALKCGDETVVVDSGLHPKMKGHDATPPHELLESERVNSIVLTHSHLDHTGTIPVVQRQFPKAKVYMTPPTYDLADAMLHNSVNVMTSQAMEHDITEYPLFTHSVVEECVEKWETRDHNRKFTVTGGIDLYFQDAGHIMGSCTASVYHDGKKVLFTGDVQTEDQTLIKGADIKSEGDYDAIIMETTLLDAD